MLSQCKNVKGFTLVEILVASLIFSIVVIGGFQALNTVVVGKVQLIQKTDIQKQIIYFSQRLFEEIKRGGSVDYEEYFNRKVVGTGFGSGHYMKRTGFGNFGKDGSVGTESSYGDDFYLCVSGNGISNKMQDEGCVDSLNNTQLDYSSYPQRYGQYSLQFIDYNANFDDDNGDENGDGVIVGDDDDEYLGVGPDVFTGGTDIKELYLISGDKTQRTLFRWNVTRDPFAPASEFCNIDENNVITGSGCLGTVEFLKLEGRDWGLDHQISTSDAGEYDGVIDTWLVEGGFGSVDDQVAGSDDKNYWIPLFPDSIHISDFKVFLYPNKDLNLSWKDPDDSINISPYVRIQLSVLPSWQTRRKIKGALEAINFSTTIALDDTKIGGIDASIFNPVSSIYSASSKTQYSCQGSLVLQNANVSNHQALTESVAWQNTSSGDFCYYQCKPGYSGPSCFTCANGYIEEGGVCKEIIGCSGTPPSNSTASNDTSVTAQNTQWQNTNSNANCYYQCTGGYTGVNCNVVGPLKGWRAVDPNCGIEDIDIKDSSGKVIQTWAGCNSTLGDGLEYSNDYCYNYDKDGDGKTDNDKLGSAGRCGAGEFNYGNSYDNALDYFNSLDGNSTNSKGDTEYNTIWGKLYRWNETVMGKTNINGGLITSDDNTICPAGRHIPSDAEWETLETTLNSGTNCRNKTDGHRCTGLGWSSDNGKKARSLANALQLPLAGYIYSSSNTGHARGWFTYLWSSTPKDDDSPVEVYYRRLIFLSYSVYRDALRVDRYGASVRCIKD